MGSRIHLETTVGHEQRVDPPRVTGAKELPLTEWILAALCGTPRKAAGAERVDATAADR